MKSQGKTLFMPSSRRRALMLELSPLALVFMATSVHAQAPAPEGGTDARASALLAQLTFDEKIDLVRGTQEGPATDQGEAGYLPGVPRLGIPSLRLADGPPGILTRLPSAAPTATMGLAATFSRADARANGMAIALEAKRLGVDVALEPFINILRDLSFGRGWNTFGEDPLLSGALASEQIGGIQGEGVMAQAKHFIGYDMTGYKTVVGDQALHEIYLAPFADAVKAGVSSIMCSYNQVNGQFACGNKSLLTDVLRGELGFKGFVTSDWGGAHHPTDLNAGMDMEMPGLMPKGSPWLTITRSYFDGSRAPVEPLTTTLDVLSKVFDRQMPEEAAPNAGIRNGSQRGLVMHGQFPDDPAPMTLGMAMDKGLVDQASLDKAVYRILHEMNRFGFLDGKTHQPTGGAPDPRVAQIIRKTGIDAAVLLKNEGHALPLSLEDFTDLALIGPGANQVVALGINAEHSLGLLDQQHGVFDLLTARAATRPGAHVRHAVANDMTGVPVPAAQWSFEGKPGLARFVDGKQVGRDEALDFTARAGTSLPADSVLRWEGDLDVPFAGTYGLYLQVLGSNASVEIDGKPLGHTASMIGARHGDTVQAGQDNLLPTIDGLDNVRRDVDLTAGKHHVTVTTEQDSSHAPVQVRLAWMTPAMRDANFREAVALGQKAKKAVIFAWARQKPLFGLTPEQNALIEQVASVNPNTVVVLNTSLPVAMPWLGKVKAVVNMWWPGDQGGEATADILDGHASPAGRLPFTWGQRIEDYPATDPRHPERGLKPAAGEVVYSEGIDVGYRWFDRQAVKPLFPFGYGLSYSSFAYSDLKVARRADRGLSVSFTLRNSGAVASDEVPQVYLDAPRAKPVDGAVAVRALAGFDRVHLAPGETRRVTIEVDPRRMDYWSEKAKGWKVVSGARTVLVGRSEQDLPLTQVVK